MAIDPRIGLAFNPSTKIEGPLTIAKEAIGLKNLMVENDLRRQQTEQARMQTENIRAEGQQRDQALADQQSWSRLWREAKGDVDQAFKLAVQDKSGPSVGYLDGVRKQHEALVDQQSKRRKEDIEADDLVRKQISEGIVGIQNLPEERRQVAYDGWLRNMQGNKNTRDAVGKAMQAGVLPPQYDSESVDNFMHFTTSAEQISKNALAKLNLGEAQAKELQSSLKIASETAPETIEDKDQLQRWYAAQSPKTQQMIGDINTLSDDKLDQIRLWAVPEKDRPEYKMTQKQFDALTTLDDAAIEKQISDLIPNTGRDANAIKTYVAAAKQQANAGDYKGFQKVLGEAARYSSGVDKSATTNVIHLSQKDSADARSGPSDESSRRSANQYLISGERPASSIGGQKAKEKFNQTVADLQQELGITDGEVAAQHSRYKALSRELSTLQNQQGVMESAEETAGINLDRAIGIMKGVTDSKSPLLNKALRSIDRKILGKEEQAAFDAAIKVASVEIAKVLSNMGGTGNGVLSDSARKEAEDLLHSDYSFKSLLRVSQVLRQDMQTRRHSVQNSINKTTYGLKHPEWDKAGRGPDDARYKIGQIVPMKGGIKAKYLGGDVNNDDNWEEVK